VARSSRICSAAQEAEFCAGRAAQRQQRALFALVPGVVDGAEDEARLGLAGREDDELATGDDVSHRLGAVALHKDA